MRTVMRSLIIRGLIIKGSRGGIGRNGIRSGGRILAMRRHRRRRTAVVIMRRRRRRRTVAASSPRTRGMHIRMRWRWSMRVPLWWCAHGSRTHRLRMTKDVLIRCGTSRMRRRRWRLLLLRLLGLRSGATRNVIFPHYFGTPTLIAENYFDAFVCCFVFRRRGCARLFFRTFFVHFLFLVFFLFLHSTSTTTIDVAIRSFVFFVAASVVVVVVVVVVFLCTGRNNHRRWRWRRRGQYRFAIVDTRFFLQLHWFRRGRRRCRPLHFPIDDSRGHTD